MYRAVVSSAWKTTRCYASSSITFSWSASMRRESKQHRSVYAYEPSLLMTKTCDFGFTVFSLIQQKKACLGAAALFLVSSSVCFVAY